MTEFSSKNTKDWVMRWLSFSWIQKSELWVTEFWKVPKSQDWIRLLTKVFLNKKGFGFKNLGTDSDRDISRKIKSRETFETKFDIHGDGGF